MTTKKMESDFDKSEELYDAGKYGKVLRISAKLAEQGHTGAKWRLGFMYEQGEGVEQDYQEAFEWYTEAADQGEEPAQYNLALLYGKGLGVEKNHYKAVSYLTLSANQGGNEAMMVLSLSYNIDSKKEALNWLNKNKEKPSVKKKIMTDEKIQEKTNAAMLWYNVEEYEEALFLFKELAEQNNVYAQQNLGYMYANGLGVKKDYIKSFKCYKKAAKQNCKQSQLALAVIYEKGIIVKKDNEKSKYWQGKAAENTFSDN